MSEFDLMHFLESSPEKPTGNSTLARRDDRVMKEILRQFQDLDRKPASLRALWETIPKVYRRVSESFPLRLQRQARVHRLDEPGAHERIWKLCKEVHDYACMHGRIPAHVAEEFAGTIYRYVFESVLDAKVHSPHDFASMYGAFLDGSDLANGKSPGTTRHEVRELIQRGEGTEAYWVIRKALRHSMAEWDKHRARTCLGLEYDEDVRVGISRVIAENVNSFCSWSDRRVTSERIYAQFETCLEHFSHHNLGYIMDLVGDEAYR